MGALLAWRRAVETERMVQLIVKAAVVGVVVVVVVVVAAVFVVEVVVVVVVVVVPDSEIAEADKIVEEWNP